jgi:hypothetical protein
MAQQNESVTNIHNLTAVEWLALRYHHRQGYLSQDDIAEAKAMEKEQIIQSHIDGFDHIVVDFKKQEYAEQYYNETYNK